MGTTPTIVSIPAPKFGDNKCDGRIVSVTIDFTQIPITEDNTFSFPEFTSNPLVGQNSDFSGFQAVELNLTDLQLTKGIESCKSIAYYWRPNFGQIATGGPLGPNADFGAAIFSSGLPLLVSSLTAQQTVVIGGQLGENTLPAIYGGVIPFLAIAPVTVRFLNLYDNNFFNNGGATNNGQGRGTFLFCDFELSPYNQANNFQMSGGG